MQYDKTSNFQCVLITNDSSSFAVFIYECGGMEWSGASIGWATTTSIYAKHLISGSVSQDIGCLYSNTYSAIVYRIDSGGNLMVNLYLYPVTMQLATVQIHVLICSITIVFLNMF